MPLHLCPAWHRLGHDGAAQLNLVAPLRMILPQALHRPLGKGAMGLGQGDRRWGGSSGGSEGPWEGHVQTCIADLPRPLHFFPLWQRLAHEGTVQLILAIPFLMLVLHT